MLSSSSSSSLTSSLSSSPSLLLYKKNWTKMLMSRKSVPALPANHDKLTRIYLQYNRAASPSRHSSSPSHRVSCAKIERTYVRFPRHANKKKRTETPSVDLRRQLSNSWGSLDPRYKTAQSHPNI